jgi:hypothetical protein
MNISDLLWKGKVADSFNLPLPDPGMVFPDTPQYYITLIMWICVVPFVAYCLYQAYKTKSPLAVLLLIGGVICYLNEPIVDVLALVWHPRPNQWVAVETFGPVPLWGLGIYIIFFGAMPYILLIAAKRGISRKAFWIGVAAFFVVDVACEIPILYYGLYYYYGDPPYMFMRLPLYWLFINTLGPLVTVALLLRAPELFKGWRMILIPLLPMTTDAAGSLASGWPIMTALNTIGASAGLKWFAATLTILIGAVIMEGLSRVICSDKQMELSLVERKDKAAA